MAKEKGVNAPREVEVAEVIEVSSDNPVFHRMFEDRVEFLTAFFTDDISPVLAKRAVGILIVLMLQGVIQAGMDRE